MELLTNGESVQASGLSAATIRGAISVAVYPTTIATIGLDWPRLASTGLDAACISAAGFVGPGLAGMLVALSRRAAGPPEQV